MQQSNDIWFGPTGNILVESKTIRQHHFDHIIIILSRVGLETLSSFFSNYKMDNHSTLAVRQEPAHILSWSQMAIDVFYYLTLTELLNDQMNDLTRISWNLLQYYLLFTYGETVSRHQLEYYWTITSFEAVPKISLLKQVETYKKRLYWNGAS